MRLQHLTRIPARTRSTDRRMPRRRTMHRRLPTRSRAIARQTGHTRLRQHRRPMLQARTAMQHLRRTLHTPRVRIATLLPPRSLPQTRCSDTLPHRSPSAPSMSRATSPQQAALPSPVTRSTWATGSLQAHRARGTSPQAASVPPARVVPSAPPLARPRLRSSGYGREDSR